MGPGYTIAGARAHDIARIAAIERAAATVLRGHAPPSVLAETTSERDLLEAQAAGRLWVALAGDQPVGFALVEMLAPDLPHLEEVDVHPVHGQRGVGTALVRAVCEWASRRGYAGITLTTFRALPFNMPFYAQLGFEEIPQQELSPELGRVVEEEAARGLDPAARAVMRYRVAAAGRYPRDSSAR